MTSSTDSSLDLSLLEKLRHHPGGRVTARCPACAREGRDRTGNHLAVFPDGRFACAAHPGDGEHRREIFSLAGRPLEQGTPRHYTQREREAYRQLQADAREREQQRQEMVRAARGNRQRLVDLHAWEPADAWDDSPQRPDSERVETCPRHFLASLFPPEALLWTGDVHDSGMDHHAMANWKTCAEWQDTPDPIGPMTTPAVWQPGTQSRCAAQVRSTPYLVLDFDGFDGVQPATPAELRAHLHASLSLIRWLREGMDWQLAAILHTGGKSLHAWFHQPPPEVLASLAPLAATLGMDPGLIGRPEHPCRLPGQPHRKTGELSRVLWLGMREEWKVRSAKCEVNSL